MTSPRAVVWMFDSGAEGFFPTSIYSLKKFCRAFYNRSLKLVVDCGVSAEFKNWLSAAAPEVQLLSVALPAPTSVVGKGESRPARVMRLRIELSTILHRAVCEAAMPRIEAFLHVDPDTLFLSDPSAAFDKPWQGEDIRCVTEWDWNGEPKANEQRFMRFLRESSFQNGCIPEHHKILAQFLNLEVGELQCMVTVNSGVWLARAGSSLPEKWRRSYDALAHADASVPAGMLNPYSAEQNALSLGIHRGEVVARFLPRRFNYLPPRPPYTWPKNVSIAHFVTFASNWNRPCFRLWSHVRAEAIQSAFVPFGLAMPQFVDP